MGQMLGNHEAQRDVGAIASVLVTAHLEGRGALYPGSAWETKETLISLTKGGDVRCNGCQGTLEDKSKGTTDDYSELPTCSEGCRKGGRFVNVGEKGRRRKGQNICVTWVGPKFRNHRWL